MSKDYILAIIPNSQKKKLKRLLIFLLLNFMTQQPMKEFWKNKKVLVTGGAGFIGSHVVENLVGLKAKVSVFDRMRDGKIKNIEYLKDKVNFIRGDCANRSDAQNACNGQEIVLNLAAHVGGIEYNISHQAT